MKFMIHVNVEYATSEVLIPIRSSMISNSVSFFCYSFQSQASASIKKENDLTFIHLTNRINMEYKGFLF